MSPLELRIHLGAVLRRERAQRGFSQEGFADALGMHRTYYGAIERGEKNLALSTLMRVGAGLSLPLSTLFSCAEARATAVGPTKPPSTDAAELP